MNNRKDSQRTINKNSPRSHRSFGRALMLVVAGLFLVFMGRFAYIAVFKNVQHHNLKSAAQQRFTQSQLVRAKRGRIYDAQGDVLAEDGSTYTIYAVLDSTQKTASGKPDYVKNKKKTAKVLAPYLNVSEQKIYQQLKNHKKGAFQVQFGSAGSNLSVSKMEEIKNRHLPGIKFLKYPARQYPEGQFARQLIGLASPVTNEKSQQVNLVGRLGLEKDLNKLLAGHNGIKKSASDLYGNQFGEAKNKNTPVKNGDDVTTTLDANIQNLLETRIDAVNDETQPSAMTGVVMEAKTGKIIAATQRPNLKSKNPIWTNSLTQDTFEPGSTMKVIALSAAIDSGNFNPNATYHSGTWSMGGGKITDWNPTGWGDITYREAFYRSSNVGLAHVEQNMGASTWKKYLNRFGFFKPVKVYGMSDEFSGYSSFKGTLQQANTAFGQGMTVNVMQLMQAFSAVANNGKMMHPYWINKVTDPSGKVVKKIKPQVVGHPISASTAKQVRKYMEGVIYDEKGTGKVYQVDGYRIAGKTGTAQIGGSNGYEKGATNYIYSIVAFAPATHPKYIIYLTLKQPKHVDGAPEKSMATITSPLIKALLNKQKTKQTKANGVVTVPQTVGMSVKKAQQQLSDCHLAVTVVGTGKTVKWQSLTANTNSVINNRIILLTGGDYKMPDLKGWSQADVASLCQQLGLKLETSGNGYVNDQSIKAGSHITKGQTIKVNFVQHK